MDGKQTMSTIMHSISSYATKMKQKSDAAKDKGYGNLKGLEDVIKKRKAYANQ